MKNFLFILVLSLAAFIFASCSGSVPKRITKLADQVEKKGGDYSLKDWEKAADKMADLLQQFADNYTSYSSSEKADVVKAVARFSAAAVRYGADSVLQEFDLDSEIDDILNSAGGLIESAKGFLEGLGL